MPLNDTDKTPLSADSLKAAIWYGVTKIVEEEEENSLSVGASEPFVGALARIVYDQALSLGKDLELYAKHANRTTIQVEDVKLATRRNEALYNLIETESHKHGLSLSDTKIRTITKARPKPSAGAVANSKAKKSATTAATTSKAAKSKRKDVSEEDQNEDQSENRTSDDEKPFQPKKRIPAKRTKSDES